MYDLLQLGFEFSAKGADQTKAKMEGVENAADRVEKKQLRAKKSTDALAASMGRAVGVAARLAAAYFGVGAALRAAESYTGMQNGLRVLGIEGDAVTRTLEDIAGVANRTRSPLESMAALYQKVSIAGKDLGTSQKDVLRFTENIGLALAQQGGSTEAASGALLQLGQALSGGVVRAEEFNSILEGAFPIAQAAANGIDRAAGSVGKLRSMVIEGEISSKEFFEAVMSQSDALEEAFGKTVPTLGQAFTVLSNNFTMFIGGLNSASGVTAKLAEGIIFLANNLERIITYAAIAAVGYGVTLVGGMIAAAGATGLLSGALTLLRRALIATGIGALIVGLGEAVLWFTNLAEKVGGFGKAFELVGDVASEVWNRIKIGFAAMQAQMTAGWLRTKANAMDALAAIVEFSLNMVNKIIGAFVGAYNAVVAVWNTLPDAFKRLGGMAINGLIDVISAGIGGLLAPINAIREAFGSEPIAPPDMSAWKAEVGEAVDVAGAAGAAFGEAFGTQYVKVEAATEGLRRNSEETRRVANSYAIAGQTLREATLAPLESVAALNAAVEEAGETTGDTTESTKKLNDALDDTGKKGGKGGKAGKAAAELKKLADEVEQLEFDANPLLKYNKELKHLEDLAKNHGLTNGAFQHAVKELNDELANSNPTIAKIGDAIGDFVAGGMRDFGNLLDGFKNMIKEMIATAIANPIKLALTTSLYGGSAGAAAAGAAGAPGGGGGLLSGLLGGGGAGGGLMSTILGSAVSGTGLIGGFSSVIGSLGIGGFGGAASSLGMALSGATTGLAGMATALGAIAVPLLAVVAVFSFFKKKTKELDAGIRITVDGMDSLVESFRKIETKRFWGLSKKVSTSYERLEQEAAEPFERIIYGMQKSIVDAAGALGIGSSAFDDFATSIQVSTKGMSEDEAQKAVEEALEKFGDEFAAMVPGLEALQKAGEGASAALQRLFTAANTVNGVLDTLGRTLYDMSLSGAAMASSLADAFGGLENLTSATNAYYQAFYTEAERTEILTRQLTTAMERLGHSMPGTRDELRALIEMQDLSTEAGRQMFAALVSLSSQFDAILPAIDSLANKLGAIAGAIGSEALTAIDKQIEASNTAAATARQSATEFFRLADSLRDAASGIGGINSADEFKNAGRKFATLFSKAISGDAQALSDLASSGQTLATDSKNFATSAFELSRMQADVRTKLNEAAAVSEAMGLGADYQAKLFDVQTAALEHLRDLINSGNVTEDLLNEQIAVLNRIKVQVADSANLQIKTSTTEGGKTVAALVDNGGRVVAGLSTEGSRHIAGLTAQTKALRTALDINGDGVISATEAQTAATLSTYQSTVQALSTAVDRNGNMTTAQIRASLAGKASDAQISAVIRAVDRNGDGIVTAEESQAARMIANYAGQTNSQTAGLIRAMDANGDGIVSATETQTAATLGKYQSTVSALVNAVNHNGNMTTAQIRASLAGKASDAQISAVIRAVDRNGDGIVTAEEAQAARLIANASSRTAAELQALVSQSTTFKNAITGQTTSVTGTQKLTNAELNKVQGLQGETVSITELVERAVEGNATLTASLLNRLSAGINVSGVGSMVTGIQSINTLLGRLISAQEAALQAAQAEANRQRTLAAVQAQLEVKAKEQQAAISQVTSASQQIFGLANQYRVFLNDKAGAAVNANTAKFGVDGNGLFQAQYGQITVPSGGNAAGFKNEYYAAGGLHSQTYGRAGELRDYLASIQQLRKTIVDLGGVPAFARGGSHMGGLRLVGERGPELEATGKSRIYSATKTQKMLNGGNDELLEEVRQMREEIRKFRDQQRQLDMNSGNDLRKIRQIEERREVDGMPPERVE